MNSPEMSQHRQRLVKNDGKCQFSYGWFLGCGIKEIHKQTKSWCVFQDGVSGQLYPGCQNEE